MPTWLSTLCSLRSPVCMVQLFIRSLEIDDTNMTSQRAQFSSLHAELLASTGKKRNALLNIRGITRWFSTGITGTMIRKPHNARNQVATMSSEQLPVAPLESLKYRATQIMESIAALQFLVDDNGQPAMPSWPDILARYNLLLSQTHSLSVSLLSALAVHQDHLGIAPPQKLKLVLEARAIPRCRCSRTAA